jgi:hypothetical protein
MIQRMAKVLSGSIGEDWLEISDIEGWFVAVCTVALSVMAVMISS